MILVSYMFIAFSIATSCNTPQFSELTHWRRRFENDTSKFIFLFENCCILIQISLKFVPNSQIDNNPVMIQLVAWHRTGDKPLSKTMMVLFTDAYEDFGARSMYLRQG